MESQVEYGKRLDEGRGCDAGGLAPMDEKLQGLIAQRSLVLRRLVPAFLAIANTTTLPEISIMFAYILRFYAKKLREGDGTTGEEGLDRLHLSDGC